VSLPGWFPDDPGGARTPVGPEEWMRHRLFERRVVSLVGPIDDRCANQVGAALMTLDADGDGSIELRIDSSGGSTGAALALMDIVDLLGVAVRGWCTGQAAGVAVGVLAVCPYRSISPHARVHLAEPSMEFEGDARLLQRLAAEHADRWAMFCRRLAEASGRTPEQIGEDAAHGRFLTAAEAVAYGIVDRIAAPDTPIGRLPPRPLGFRPH
jgi:ATP-dependent Clp protease protease subunit